jgi:hypothetical protein
VNRILIWKKIEKENKRRNLLIDNKLSLSTWQLTSKCRVIFTNKQKPTSKLGTINHEDPLCVFENEKKDVIIKTKEFKYLFLEYLHPLIQYEIPLTSKVLYNPGFC